MGDIRNTRRWKKRTAITWMMRLTLDHENGADQGKIELGAGHDGQAPKAAPRASAPVSPMNTAAGNELYHRKPMQPPIRLAASMARSLYPFSQVIPT